MTRDRPVLPRIHAARGILQATKRFRVRSGSRRTAPSRSTARVCHSHPIRSIRPTRVRRCAGPGTGSRVTRQAGRTETSASACSRAICNSASRAASSSFPWPAVPTARRMAGAIPRHTRQAGSRAASHATRIRVRPARSGSTPPSTPAGLLSLHGAARKISGSPCAIRSRTDRVPRRCQHRRWTLPAR